MKVHKIIHTIESSDIELSVSLQSKDGDILTHLSQKESFREYFALLEVPTPSASNILPAVSASPGQQPQDDQTSLSPKIIKSEIDHLKTNVESLILRLRKDEDLVKDLDRRTDEMKEVCKSVVSLPI